VHYADLWSDVAPKGQATVIGMLGHCHQAEDVGQEVFIRFYKSLKSFKGKSTVGTNITRKSVNVDGFDKRSQSAKYLKGGDPAKSYLVQRKRLISKINRSQDYTEHGWFLCYTG